MSVDDALQSRPAPSIDIVSIDSPDDPLLPAFRQLVRDFLTELGESLDYQGVEEELAALPGKFSRSQRGCMYIAVDRSSSSASSSPTTPIPVGCIGLRHLHDNTGELKRMYVNPHYRNQQIAHKLVTTVINTATQPHFHYTHLRLDTLARLTAANRLYRRLGFVEIEAYNECPIEGAMWFELDVSKSGSGGSGGESINGNGKAAAASDGERHHVDATTNGGVQ